MSLLPRQLMPPLCPSRPQETYEEHGAHCAIEAFDRGYGFKPVDGIRLECLTQQEAEKMRELIKQRRPEIPIYLTWLFGRS